MSFWLYERVVARERGIVGISASIQSFPGLRLTPRRVDVLCHVDVSHYPQD